MIDKEADDADAGGAGGQRERVAACSDNNNNLEPQRRAARVAEKYGLRPRTVIRRLQQETRRQEPPKREARPLKHRPPPLSKYRRKTANARERHRMREINEAFETLRGALPEFCSRRAAAAMTKITTLKLAVNYIRALSHILQDGHPGDISFFDGLNLSDICSPGLPVLSPHSCSAHSDSAPPSAARTPLGSNSDISDLLSDDSSMFEDNMDVFDNIAALPEADPFTFLLTSDPDSLSLDS